MVGKGILVGTEALVYFKLVSQDWTYQPSCYDEFDFSGPMEYRHVYCEKDEEPPWLMVAMPPQSHCIPTSSSIDEPVSSTVWYTNPSPRLTKKTVPIYNLNKKFRLMNLGEKFSSASETNNRRALVGTANQPVLENTQWCTHQGYPHVSLPRVPPPGSECVSRGRPDTGPNKPVAVLRRLKHSFLQDHKCFKLEDDTTRLIDSDQWQLIKVLVLQDLINVMLPLLQQEEGREEGPDQPRAAQQHICLDTFPHNNSRDHNHSTNPCNNSIRDHNHSTNPCNNSSRDHNQSTNPCNNSSRDHNHSTNPCNNSSRDHNHSTNPCNINNSRRFHQSIEACTSSRQQHQSSTDEETQTADKDHTTSCSYASEKHEQHSKSKDSSFFTLQGFPCCCCDASGSVSPMSQDTGTPQSRVNDTRAALMHIFNIEQEEFSNVYYNILEMRCYHHVLLLTVCEGRVLPILPPHEDDHQGGVDLTSCIVRYVSRTADTKGVHRMVSTSSSLFSMLNAQHITEESDQTDLHEVAIKPSKPGSKILKNVKRQFAKKRPHLSKLSPQQDSSKWFTQDASSPRSLQEASSPQPSLDASSSLFSYDASSLKSGQDASSPRSLQDAYSPQSLQDASSRLLSYNTQSVGSARIASSESLSDAVHFHRASEDVLCTAETDRAETTSSGGTWQAAWEQTFLCLSDSTVNSWLDFEIRNRSVTNKPSDGPCESRISKRGVDDSPPLAGHDEDDGSLGHTTLSLKNLETSAAEKNITLILSEKPDSSFITELENLVEPETPSKVDLEDPSTTHPAARSNLTGAKKKNVLNKIKSKTKKLTKQPFFHRKPNLTDKDIQIIQELPDDPLFNNSSEQTLDKRVQTESVSEQTNISTGIGQSANIVGNKLLEASSPTEEGDVTPVNGRRIPRPHSLHLAENGVTLAHCSIDQAKLRVSLAGRQPRIKQFHCPLTPRVVIYLIHEAEIKCRWSETLPNTPFRGVVAPPLQPVVEAVRGASGLSQAQWAQLLLTDLLALLKEPQTSHANDETRQSSHGGRSSEFTLTGTGPGRWCPNPSWCRRAGRAIDFGYVQSLFTESKVQDGRTNVDEKNIEVCLQLSESWLELCKVLLRGLLAAFSDTSRVIGTLELENCTRLAQWLCRDVSSSSSGRVTEMAARGRLLDALVDHDIAWWVVVMECYTEHDFEDVPVSQSKNSDHKEQSNPISARKGASTTVASTTEKLLRTLKKGSQSSMKEPNPKSIKINANSHPRKSCGSAATAKTSGMSSAAPRSSRGKTFRSFSKKRHHSGANKNDIHVKTRNFFKKMQVFSRKQKPELRVDAAATKLNAEARAATKLEKMAQMAEHVLRHLRSISKEYSPIFERNLSILYFDAVYDVIIKKFMFWLQLELTKVFALADISTEPLTFSDCATDTEQSCDLSNQDQLNNSDLTEAGHPTQKEAKQLETDGWVIINSPCFDKCNGATNNMAHPPGAAGASSVWYIEEESSTQSTLLPTQVNQHSAVALLGTNTPMGHIYRTVKKILRLKEQHVKQQLRDTLPSFGGFGTSPSILSNIISQSCPYIAENSQNSPLFSPSSLFPDVSNSVCSSSMYLQVEDTSVVMQPESAVDVTLESVVDCVNKTRRNSSHVKFSAVELDKASVDMNGNKSKVDHSNVTSKDQTLKRNKECPRTVDKPSLFSGMLQNTKRKVCNERDLSLIVQEPIQSESLNDSSKVPDHSNHDMNDDHCISTRHDDELVYGNDSSLHALSNTVLRVYSVLRFNSNIMNIFKKWLLPVLLGTIKTYLSNAEKILSNDEEKDDFASKLIHMPCASEQVLMASSNSLGSTKFGRVPSAHDVTLNNGFLASEMTIDMRNIRISSSAIDLQDTVFILMNSWKKLDWHDTLAKDSDMTRPAVINTDKHDRPLNMRKEKTKELSANHKQSSGLKHQNKLKKGLIIAARKMVVENLPGNKIVSSLPMLDFSSAASIHPKQSEQISETKLFSDQELPLVADKESPADLSQPIKKKEFAYLTNVKKKITSAYPTTKNNIFSKKTPPRTSDVTATSDASDASHKKEDTLDENVVDDLVEQVSSRFFAQTDQSSKVTALDPGTILMKELSSLCLRYCRRVHDKLLQMKPWNHDDQKTKMCVGLNNIAETMAILRQVPDHLCAGDTKSRSNLVDALDTIGNVGHSVLHHLIQERTVAVEESVVQCCVDRSSMPIVEGALYDDFIIMKEHLTRPFFAFYRTKTYDIVRNKLADTKKPPKDASYGMNCDELEQAFRDFFDVDG